MNWSPIDQLAMAKPTSGSPSQWRSLSHRSADPKSSPTTAKPMQYAPYCQTQPTPIFTNPTAATLSAAIGGAPLLIEPPLNLQQPSQLPQISQNPQPSFQNPRSHASPQNPRSHPLSAAVGSSTLPDIPSSTPMPSLSHHSDLVGADARPTQNPSLQQPPLRPMQAATDYGHHASLDKWNVAIPASSRPTLSQSTATNPQNRPTLNLHMPLWLILHPFLTPMLPLGLRNLLLTSLLVLLGLRYWLSLLFFTEGSPQFAFLLSNSKLWLAPSNCLLWIRSLLVGPLCWILNLTSGLYINNYVLRIVI